MRVNITKIAHNVPELPYDAMKDRILGKSYTLSLTFVGSTRAKALNKAHRNATYVPNVLSFPLDDAHGEIYITPIIAEREAKKFSMTRDGYIGFLFIHGLLHLKGHLHGDTMEKAERTQVAHFKLT